ncbi:MAG: NAD(P)H-dependent oxidoreductase [Pseudomonadota bacterium]
MKTLLITYLPRGDRSHTKKLVDFFKENYAHPYEELNLLKDPPDFFLTENLSAYIHHHYLGEKFSPQEEKSMAKMERMTSQFKNADRVVIAFPMYNFSLPGMVKCYFDSVMLKGETWDAGPNGYQGLMAGKKALALSASGGNYQGERSGWDHCLPLAETLFRFMGFTEVDKVAIAGVNMPGANVEKMVKDEEDKLRSIIEKWDA